MSSELAGQSAADICRGFDLGLGVLVSEEIQSDAAWSGMFRSLWDQASAAGEQKLAFAFGLMFDPVTGEVDPNTFEGGLQRALDECAALGVVVGE